MTGFALTLTQRMNLMKIKKQILVKNCKDLLLYVRAWPIIKAEA